MIIMVKNETINLLRIDCVGCLLTFLTSPSLHDEFAVHLIHIGRIYQKDWEIIVHLIPFMITDLGDHKKGRD